MRFRDDFPVHGKLLPLPPMVVVHVETPDEICRWICHRLDQLRVVAGIGNDTGLSKNIVDLLLTDPLVDEVFQFRAEGIAGSDHSDGPPIFHDRHVSETIYAHDM